MTNEPNKDEARMDGLEITNSCLLCNDKDDKYSPFEYVLSFDSNRKLTPDELERVLILLAGQIIREDIK